MPEARKTFETGPPATREAAIVHDDGDYTIEQKKSLVRDHLLFHVNCLETGKYELAKRLSPELIEEQILKLHVELMEILATEPADIHDMEILNNKFISIMNDGVDNRAAGA